MSRQRVLVTSNDVPQAGIDLLKAKFDVTILQSPVTTREQVLQALPGHDAIFLAGHHVVNKELLDVAGPRLKVVSTASAGYDHLDVPEIKRRGLKVGNTPHVLTAAVAEVAVMLTLNAARRAHEGRIKIVENKWESRPQWILGRDLRGSTVGIVGLGNIGQAIVKRLKPFEVGRFVYSGHSRKQAGDDLGATFVSFADLLKESDFVIVATPLTNETANMFNDDAFAQMKNTAVLVNVGRGPVVDTDALVRALRNHTIFAAGLDVMNPEPLPSNHPLLSLPNAVIIPHLGSATVKTRSDMATTAAQNVINGLEGKPLVYEL
ncbi:glyoxylate reductase/hydroxypyruvate reductase-like [Diprion similis]|uniref:glyoxylate reductase/hydroxypyruvate reductase-like n=1 Tax=Diprion similis TaxID=362088 RepID=UPI001EF8F1CE|nr:glyoxylate reductase/hydroxypyruvate reductase-like [Diprion similis]XP_046734071.1 glyoxylate reductase/hydroxypyruvate reductase-like [Diprion similis]